MDRSQLAVVESLEEETKEVTLASVEELTTTQVEDSSATMAETRATLVEACSEVVNHKTIAEGDSSEETLQPNLPLETLVEVVCSETILLLLPTTPEVACLAEVSLRTPQQVDLAKVTMLEVAVSLAIPDKLTTQEEVECSEVPTTTLEEVSAKRQEECSVEVTPEVKSPALAETLEVLSVEETMRTPLEDSSRETLRLQEALLRSNSSRFKTRTQETKEIRQSISKLSQPNPLVLELLSKKLDSLI